MPNLSLVTLLWLSSLPIASSTTDWYSDACTGVSEQYSLDISFSGKSAIIDLSVFKRRIIKGLVKVVNFLRAFLS